MNIKIAYVWMKPHENHSKDLKLSDIVYILKSEEDGTK